MLQNSNTINIEHVSQALNAIHQSNVSSEQIKAANAFLQQCETNSKFPASLIAIYCHTQEQQLQLSALLLLKNVIKRNWSNRRNNRSGSAVNFSESQKQQLRNSVLSIYGLHDMRNYKHLNELIRYLTRLDFPSNYGQLHQFVGSSLQQLSGLLQQDVKGLICSDRVLIVLSTCKAVLKEYSMKKVSHSEDSFLEYISEIVTQAVVLSTNLHPYLQLWIKSNEVAAVVRLLECLRKVDKVIVYAISTIPSKFQYNQEISQIVLKIIEHVNMFDRILAEMVSQGKQGVCEQLQKYMGGLLEQVGRLQISFPFMFRPFLSQYLMMLMTMLVQNMPKSNLYKDDKLLSVIVIANLKPLNTFAYYQSPEEFGKSIYCRKGSEVNCEEIQRQCNTVFRQIYNAQTVQLLVSSLLTQIMSAAHIVPNDQAAEENLILQDAENAAVDQISEPTVYQNCVTFCKSLIKCFKVQSKGLVGELARSVSSLQAAGSHNRQLIKNIMEIILLLPQIYEEGDLPLQQVCCMMQALYAGREFIYLSRLLRKYHSFLGQNTIKNGFTILAKIVASPLSQSLTAQIIYQSALALKAIISQTQIQEALPIELVGGCVSNLVVIMTMAKFKSNPNLTWPIINLLVRFVKSISSPVFVNEIGITIVQGLSGVIQQQKNQELIVNALSQLLATLISQCFQFSSQFPVRGQSLELDPIMTNLNPNSFIVLQGCYLFLLNNLRNRNLENYQTLYRLWLTLICQYPTVYQQELYGLDVRALNLRLVELFQSFHQQVRKQNPVIFVEILQEYFVIGLLPLTEQELTEMVKSGFQAGLAEEERLRIILALASLYFSYAILVAPVQYALLQFVGELVNLKDQISPQINSLRTFLFLLIDYHILNYPANDLFALFTSANDNVPGKWLQPFYKSMQFVTNKFALQSLLQLANLTLLPCSNPYRILEYNALRLFQLLSLLKIIAVELDTIKLDFMFSSYNGIFRTLLPNIFSPEFRSASRRKIRLLISDRLVRSMIDMDLRPSFQHHIGGLLNLFGWDSEYLKSRIGQSCANQICKQLGWAMDEPSLQ